jgi:hypothetical protein
MAKWFKQILIFAAAGIFCAPALAQDYRQAGVDLLHDLGTNLDGTGVRVAQVEAPEDVNGHDWEVSPTYVNRPAAIFTYISNGVSSNGYPNSLGGESSHADSVGWNFYDLTTGVATNVAHIDIINAVYFGEEFITTNATTTNYTVTLSSSNLNDPVVNQSYIYTDANYDQPSAKEQEAIDSAYDDYAVKYNTLFVNGAGDGSPPHVCPPATSYNGIGVGVFEGNSSSVGPTVDNGRCKPDLTAIAPGGATSFSAPIVAGAAAVLMQAGLRGDGGNDTNAAANMITVKALLLNGAVKPADWANSPPSPLDYRYGAGVLNVFNSYEQLAGGKHGYNFFTNIPAGTAHPPMVTAASVPVLNGWDFNTDTSSSSKDGVNHYFFNATNRAAFTLAATLVWNRHQNVTAINNLALYLYNAANSNLVASSTSVVDNVQHIFVPQLPQGRYDLQVWKAGGGSIVSTSEPYALAWEMTSQSLSIAESGSNVRLSWPAYPAGFAVAEASSLAPPVVWSTNNVPLPVFTNNQEVLWLSPSSSAQFFRLLTPDF